MRLAALMPALSLILCAEAPLPIAAPIQKVRLHPDEAWVTRVGKVHVPGPGVRQVLFRDLPAGLSVEDVRVSARGPKGSRLGDLTVGSEVRKVTETPEYRALKAEREALGDRMDALEAEGEALAQEGTFLRNLQASHDKELSGRMTYALPGAAAVVELSRGIQGRTTEILTRDRKRKHELAKLKEEANRLDQELNQRAAQTSISPSRAQVEVSSPAAGDFEVELTYRTRQARWTPSYEARLSADGKTLEMILFAAVEQRSGEDWDGVQVEVTNARASRSLTLAAFAGPQNVTYSEEPPMGKRARSVGAVMEVMASPAAPAPAQNSYIADKLAVEDMEAKPLEEAQGLAITWALEGAKDVPADHAPHRFRVLAREVAPALALVTVPRLDPTVFRVARFALPQGIPLFPGAPMVHYAGTQRVGQADLLLPGPGKPLQLGFGPFRGVRVALQRVDAAKEMVGAFTKETQWTLTERFEVSNDTEEPVLVEVQDRELKAASDRIKIALLPGSTPPQEGPRPGVRAWTVKLEAKAAGQVNLATQIRTPLGGYVSGLGNLELPN